MMESGLRLAAFLYLVDIIGANPLGIRGDVRRDVSLTCKECWTIGARTIPGLVSSNFKTNSSRMHYLFSDSKFD